MVKRILYLFILLVFPLTVWADTISFDCPNKVKTGDSFSCDIYGNTSNMVGSLSIKVNVNDIISLDNFAPTSDWQGQMTQKGIGLYNAEEVTGNFKIGTIKLKALKSGTGKITTSEVIFSSDVNNTTNTIDDIAVEIEVVSATNNVENKNNDTINTNDSSDNSNNVTDNNATSEVSSTYLIGLIIEKYPIDFKKDVFDYEITIDDKDEILKIEPLLEDENATYDIIGNNNLKDGSIVSVVVTDSFGESKRSYNIKIHKKELKYVNKYSIVFMIIIGILVLINIIRIVSKNKRKVNGG